MSCFTLQASSGTARAGTLHTAHGDIQTPAFMPVGTQASVKSVSPQELSGCGVGLILANAYHLYLRPGAAIIMQAGGLHRFMGWDGAILTDSGGFQVFSLARLSRVDDDGYHFASHLDGSRHTFTPESVAALQAALGSDIAMVLDECAPAGVDEAAARTAAERTLRWAERARGAPARADQLSFAIAQGATFEPLRRMQCRALTALDFAGYAIGGLWLGEPKSLSDAMVMVCCEELPAAKPRYLMGVGSPDEIANCIAAGVDMFDSVYPTRCARHALALTSAGRLNLRNSANAGDMRPLDQSCACLACSQFSRAYIAHCFRAGEMLAARLVSIHNLAFLTNLVQAARAAILQGQFAAWREQRRTGLAAASAKEN